MKKAMPVLPPPTLGVILAGGLARRMGGSDKPLLRVGGRTLLEHVAQRLGPQCAGLILNANREPSRFAGMDLTIVPDSIGNFPGPLAGILTALEWTAVHHPGMDWVVSVPCDTPFIPGDLTLRLHEARQAAGLSVACALSGQQVHFAAGLWPVDLRHDLRDAIESRGIRSIKHWANAHGCATAPWPCEPIDPFFNVNTPEQLAQAETMVE